MAPRRFLRRRASSLFSDAFELWIGFVSFVTAIAYFAAPSLLYGSSVGEQAGSYAFVWSLLDGIGGLAVVYGLVRPALRFELAGLMLLAAAAVVNATAIIAFRGVGGVGAALIYASFVPASGMRGYLVWRVHGLTVWDTQR